MESLLQLMLFVVIQIILQTIIGCAKVVRQDSSIYCGVYNSRVKYIEINGQIPLSQVQEKCDLRNTIMSTCIHNN